MSKIIKYLKAKQTFIDSALDRLLPSSSTEPVVLHQAIRHSMFAGGKRIRPVLCLATVEALQGKEEMAVLPAAALECIHTYSLIHDDLPAMDDDDLRRGKPTCHVVFGEAQAILAGDALLTIAFEFLGRAAAPAPYSPTQYAVELAQAAGSGGMVAGQSADILAEGTQPTKKQLSFIHKHKTGALLRASVRMGAIAGGATDLQMQALTVYAEKIGLAFQIVDDVLNATADEAELGKPVGSDEEREKVTYVSLYGVDESKERATELIEDAITELAKVDCSATALEDIARFVGHRAY